MKLLRNIPIFIIVLLSYNVFAIHEINVYSIDETIQLLLNFFKQIGAQFFPINIEKFEQELKGDIGNGYIKLNNITLDNLIDFTNDKIIYKEDVLHLKLPLTFNSIPITLHYAGDLQLFNFIPLFGEGDLSLLLTKLSLILDIDFKLIEGDHKVKDIKFIFDLAKCDIKLTGLNNDEDISQIVSKELEYIIPEFLKEKGDWIGTMLAPLLINFLNSQDLNALFE